MNDKPYPSKPNFWGILFHEQSNILQGKVTFGRQKFLIKNKYSVLAILKEKFSFLISPDT